MLCCGSLPRSKNWTEIALLVAEQQAEAGRQAEEYAKHMQLNVIRLSFRAYLQDETGGYSRMLDPVISKPVYDSSEYLSSIYVYMQANHHVFSQLHDRLLSVSWCVSRFLLILSISVAMVPGFLNVVNFHWEFWKFSKNIVHFQKFSKIQYIECWGVKNK